MIHAAKTNDFVSFDVVEGDAACGLIFICDHARNTVPAEYGSLGLAASEFERHIAFDIGAEALTKAMAAHFNAPVVHSCFSRLLIDPNRGEDDPTIVMRLSDGTVVPGNHPISEAEIQNRIERFHKPYHSAIDDTIDRSLAVGVNPIIFSTHSFTPNWRGFMRPWEVAMLWDADPRLAQFMIAELRKEERLTVGDNEPYDGALKNDTMYRHASIRGLAHGLIEVRQDLIGDMDGVEDWANRLIPVLEKANARPDMHELQFFGSRTDGTAKSVA